MSTPRDGGNLLAKVGRLTNQAAEGAVLGKLTRLRQSAADHDWPLLLKTLQTGR